MIEKRILDYLNATLNYPAYMELPPTIPSGQFVVVEKTNGGMENLVKSATIVVQSYGDNLFQAAQLNNRVVGTMLAIIEADDNIGSCKLNSDYNFTNTAQKKYRYQAVFNLIYM